MKKYSVIGQSYRAEFTELNIKDAQLREKIGTVIKSLVINHGGSEKQGVAIDDGPERVSSWDDEVNEVVIGVTATHVIIDEAGSTSAVQFIDVSTETLVDTLCALEKEVNNERIQIDDYSEEIK